MGHGCAKTTISSASAGANGAHADTALPVSPSGSKQPPQRRAGARFPMEAAAEGDGVTPKTRAGVRAKSDSVGEAESKHEPVTHVTPTLIGSRSSVRHVELDQGPSSWATLRYCFHAKGEALLQS